MFRFVSTSSCLETAMTDDIVRDQFENAIVELPDTELDAVCGGGYNWNNINNNNNFNYNNFVSNNIGNNNSFNFLYV